MSARYDHTGKVVLVTGGTKGLGAGIARGFLAAGAEVVVCARGKPAAPVRARLSGAGRPWRTARFVQADVRETEDVERLVGGLERLDVLVNNAGGTPSAPLAETSPRLHRRVIELNLIAPLLLSRRAHPLLAAARGAIVMIGSVSGVRPSPGTTAYGAAKAGLHHLAACLAAEWAPRVRVNTVVVGLAETGEAPDHYASAGDPAVRSGDDRVGRVPDHYAGEQTSNHRAGERTSDHRAGERASDRHAGEWAPDHRAGEWESDHRAGEWESDHRAGGRAPDRHAGESGAAVAASTIPSGRMARPEDVADACLWLAGPGYVTGAQLLVHGGGEIPAWRWAVGR